MKRVIMTVTLVALIGFGSAAYAQDVKEVKTPPENMEKPEGAPEMNGERPEKPEMSGENADGTAPEPPKGPKDNTECTNKECDKAPKEAPKE
ncbi:MAG: hypothetical protein LUC88_01190 [Prevotella sp.]|nr:hypothetical protein [Prevotella sp.]